MPCGSVSSSRVHFTFIFCAHSLLTKQYFPIHDTNQTLIKPLRTAVTEFLKELHRNMTAIYGTVLVQTLPISKQECTTINMLVPPLPFPNMDRDLPISWTHVSRNS